MNGNRSIEPFPFLHLRLVISGSDQELNARVDTGFDGAIIVPDGFLDNIPTDFWTYRWTLADGSAVYATTCEGTIELDGFQALPVVVSSLGPEVLVGVEVLRHYRVILDHGQRVVVEP